MENNLSRVSIIIPCRNEEKFIGKCLDSIIEQDYPKEKLEVLVIDGNSKDHTKKIAESYSHNFSFIKIFDNPKKYTPSGLNIGIKNAGGDLIIRMDAHTSYNKKYVSMCARYSNRYKADNVGGVIFIIPRENTLIGRGIAKAMSSFLGSGDARYKIGVGNFMEVDTVPFGCYKKEVFDKIGLFNENLERSQDMEFNLRLKKYGGKIYLFPDIVSYYYARSNFKDFFIHNFKDGIWAVYPFKFTKTLLKLRHYVPLIFVLGLIILLLLGLFLKLFLYVFFGVIFLYVLILIYSSIKVSLKEKDATYLFSLPVSLIVRHFSYGLGSIFGLLKLLK